MVVVSFVEVRYTGPMMRVLQWIAIGCLITTADVRHGVIPEALGSQVREDRDVWRVWNPRFASRGKVVSGREGPQARGHEGRDSNWRCYNFPWMTTRADLDRMHSKGRFLALHKEFLDPRRPLLVVPE